MRFFQNGPDIPDSLLEKRDQGQVVFLCGAGISIPANMPDFPKLTRNVIDFFDPPEHSPIAQEFKPWRDWIDNNSNTPRVSLDQIFLMLNKEYGRNEVNSQVARHLQVNFDKNFHSKWHEIIMQLSADQEGNPQVVTTNFDLLLEHTSKGGDCPIHIPPAFPSIEHGVPIKGITYLHGRLQEPESSHHAYVLSSADFGRAYLSEGWATSFIQSLLTSYTVVLLGYSAEDPPVKYLLQGLNRESGYDSSSLYAFDRGTQSEVDSKWDDRGVTGIAFSEFEHLWESLEAWRDRAASPRKWMKQILQLAQKHPQNLRAYERGQVAHLVKTTSGAKLFAHAEILPPADWLCVFDRECRVAKPSKDYGATGEVFNPIEVFGLDDEKTQSDLDSTRDSVYEHLLEWRRGDSNPPYSHKLGSRGYLSERLPSRLEYITFWMAKLLNEPLLAWWAMRQSDLHPRVLNELSNSLRRNTNLHPKAREIWALILESHYQQGSKERDFNWFYFRDKLKIQGWTKSIIRQFEEVTKPYIDIESMLGLSASKPPLNDWDKLKISDLARFEIKFSPRHGESVSIPDDVLLEVTHILSNNLVKAVGLRLEVGSYDFESPTCYPKREVQGNVNNKHDLFVWFISLFTRLKDINPSAARALATLWPKDEEYYFLKLKLFAYNMDLFKADEAIQFIFELSQEQLWHSNIKRELLFLIHDRWSEFSSIDKDKLLTRLLDGPDKEEYWEESEYEIRKNEQACLYTKWLVLQGCKLSQGFNDKLEEIIRALPEWRDTWAMNFTLKQFMQVRSVRTDESPEYLKGIPLNKVAQVAEACCKRDFDDPVRKRPFSGLVYSEPRRALASLSFEAKKQNYPISLWAELIGNWPNDVSKRLHHTFLNRLLRLPKHVVYELRNTIGRWFREHFHSIFINNESLSWKLFDHGLDGFISEVGGNEHKHKAQREIVNTSCGPIADLTEGLLTVVFDKNLNKDVEISDEFKAKLETLINVDRCYREQVIATLCCRIQLFYDYAPEWTKEHLLPKFDFVNEDAEAAWYGYALSGGHLGASVTVCLKPLILEVFHFLYEWGWDQRATNFFAQVLVELALDDDKLPVKVSHREARHCIRSMRSDDRREVVAHLSIVGQRESNGWSNYVLPFINTIWPRESDFRTSTLTSEWLSLLASSGDKFSCVFRSVRRGLSNDIRNTNWLYRFKHETNGECLAVVFPDDVLDVLDLVIPNHIETIPYYLEEVLKLTIESNSALLHDPRYIRLAGLIENF
ncbi:TPA: SIR2 family protein [Vibrio parahaemolyticus]